MASANESSRQRQLMRRAIREARRADGRTHPNPMVGCVVVRDDQVAATGFHSGPGRKHAEAAALDSLDRNADGCEVYVNLEPCCHQGRTPPCTDRLVEAGVDRVVIGVIDPDPRMSGEGVRQLREAGIEVVTGVLEQECRALNRAYFKYIEQGRPWVSVKYAMTMDGKIATATGDSAWVTGEAARRRVHELRDRYDAIMVGTGTLKSDNPRLTARIEDGEDPVRVILDTRLEAPLDSNVYQESDGGKEDDPPETIAVVSADRLTEPEVETRAETLRNRGLEILPVEENDRGLLAVDALLEELAERDLVRLFVEGGGRLIGSLFDAGAIDHVYAFVATKMVGGRDATGPNQGTGLEMMADAVELADREIERLGEDLLISGDLERGAAEPRSAEE